MLLLIFIICTLLYQAQALFLARGLLSRLEGPPEVPIPLSNVGILIVHRNELMGLEDTIRSISKQLPEQWNWPIYVLDDHSSEMVREELLPMAARLNFRLWMSQVDPGKKNALKGFLPTIAEDYLIQTDADCKLGPGFLQQMNHALHQNPDLVVARVEMEASKNIWSRLAALDHLSLQLVTFSGLAQGKSIMAAGAAMAFRRKAFLAHINTGEEWVGGEDTFFAQALARSGGKICALPQANVITEAPANFKSFLNQRIRWGAKSRAYPSTLAKLLALSVAITNLYILLGFIYLSFYDGPNFPASFWLIKMSGDALLLYRFASLYGGQKLLKGYLLLAVLYPFYIVLVISLIPFSGKKKWLAS